MYQDMFDKQIALSMSQNQGLGLGAQLTRQLSAAAAANANPGTGTAAPTGGITRSALPATSSLAVNPDANGADASESAAVASSPSEFVSEVFPAIQRAAAAIGVNPVAMLAQAALETGWGKRMARNADGTPSRNLFGIKADDSWNGAKVAADTLEFSGGVAVPRRTAFRAYGSIEESVNDFARLLSSSPRYRDAVAGGANAQAYIAGIGKSGYATDPQYANKLNDILNSGTLRAAMTKHRGTTET
jgi:flagellar protein FlgJ